MKSAHIGIVGALVFLLAVALITYKPQEVNQKVETENKGQSAEVKMEAKKDEVTASGTEVAPKKVITNLNTKTKMTEQNIGGMIIVDEVVGTGQEAKSGDSVTVHYKGTLTNGTVFDASRNHGDQGFTFALGAGQVIKGWDLGVAGMKVGGKRKLTIPSDMAYGNQAVGGVIPANATLVFEVELLKVGK